MRGGTSRGRTSSRPICPRTREAGRVLLAVMGSPHALQVDGIGGSNTLTSKVAIVSRSQQKGADVDYLFAQVSVSEALVDTKPNCGNMLAGVGPFAIETGLVKGADSDHAGAHLQREHGDSDRGDRANPGGEVQYEGTQAHRRGERPGGADQAHLPRCARSRDRQAPAERQRARHDPGGGSDLHRHGDAARHHGGRGLRQDRARISQELDADRAFMQKMEAIRLEAGRRMG